ncbi:MAG TPA: WD40 repeat domain-containing protein, partial [Cyanophyceae cyanobacterium]
WNLDTGEEVRTLEGHSEAVFCLAISSDGQILASGSSDNTIKIWNYQTGEILQTISDFESEILSMVISPDNQTLISGSGLLDGKIKIWNLKTGELIQTFPIAGRSLLSLGQPLVSIESLAINPQGTLLVSGGSDNKIRIWDLSTGKLIRTLYGHSDWVKAVTISPDGQTLVSGGGDADETVMIWRL